MHVIERQEVDLKNNFFNTPKLTPQQAVDTIGICLDDDDINLERYTVLLILH